MADINDAEITALTQQPTNPIKPNGHVNVMWELNIQPDILTRFGSDPDVRDTGLATGGLAVLQRVRYNGEIIKEWTDVYENDFSFNYQIDTGSIEGDKTVLVEAYGASSGNPFFVEPLARLITIEQDGNTAPGRNQKLEQTSHGSDTPNGSSNLWNEFWESIFGEGGLPEIPVWIWWLAILIVILIILLIVNNLVG